MREAAFPEVPFVDLRAQFGALEDEVVEAMTAVLRRGDLILGEALERFEDDFAEYCEADFAVGVDSGTSALELTLRGYGIGPGDEVITAANTFVATVIAITAVGASPVLVDVDPVTHTIDVDGIAGAVTERTRAVLPVHLYGQPADMDPILDFAEERGLLVIEDACQAHGARYKGRRAGSLGSAAAFSFYPAKNLGAYGDGGAVVTNDERLARSIKLLRDFGQREKYRHDVVGFNRRLDTVQAAALRVKLRRLDAWNEARRQHAAAYDELLHGLPVVTPNTARYAEHVWHLYVIRVADRDSLRSHLAAKGIATGIHYPIPVYLQPPFRGLGDGPGTFPVTEACADELISLPMFPELTREAIEFVAGSITSVLGYQHVDIASAASPG
jgi:dTDP-4-amino-4,6-dideoxygalactose transaminase